MTRRARFLVRDFALIVQRRFLLSIVRKLCFRLSFDAVLRIVRVIVISCYCVNGRQTST